jgi:hypothetical protein
MKECLILAGRDKMDYVSVSKSNFCSGKLNCFVLRKNLFSTEIIQIFVIVSVTASYIQKSAPN